MKIGLGGRGFDGDGSKSGLETLALASEYQLDGFFFPTAFDVSRTLDRGELRAARDLAQSLGLYIEVGIGKVNPNAADPRVEELGDGDLTRGMSRLIASSHLAGSSELWCMSGGNRFIDSPDWSTQLQGIEGLLRALAPHARDLGCHLNLETHEDITTFEVVNLVESIGPDVMGVTLDIANVVVWLEDPVAAASRVAPYLRQTHIEDVSIHWVEMGLRRRLRDCGEGIVDWTRVMPILNASNSSLNLTIELHNGQFEMPIFDNTWLDRHPDLTPRELAEVVRLTTISGVEPDSVSMQMNRRDRALKNAAYLRNLP